MTREELATRVEAFKRDLPRLNAPVVAATMIGVLIIAASIYFKRRDTMHFWLRVNTRRRQMPRVETPMTTVPVRVATGSANALN